ncbi:GNAT family N-acetyltransferase [Kribbella deserti]|uniref:GNAT family N-acetyltransferase n=1 Tax=Kribbella deserti TaxID=1926257 RepID=A0ABV6QI17_9ACTN
MSTDILIRAADPAELPAVYELMVTGFADVFGPAFGGRPADVQRDVLVRLRQCRPEPATGLVVAIRDGKVVGATEWRTTELAGAGLLPRLLVLTRLGPVGLLRFAIRTRPIGRPPLRTGEAQLPGTVVAPGNQGLGIGRSLLAYSLEVTERAGVRIWRDLVAEENLASRAMLTALGFREVARFGPSWWQRRLGASASLVMERRAEG